MHFGKITFDVDERGEVGLLTRNIVSRHRPTRNNPSTAGT
jgi:hypothetical protein